MSVPDEAISVPALGGGAEVGFDGVGKLFAGGTRALSDLSLVVDPGEFLVLVGPSGCGKTTALRIVAGLESPTEGTVSIDGRPVNNRAAGDRDVAMVFQNYALYPHMTVYENIGFGLRMRHTPRKEIRTRVLEIARVLGLEDLLERKPRALSGGQRQRVAMGRAIVRNPSVFLMDEPLSNLDASLRVYMRSEIARIQHQLSTTTIYVTHDQVEAMTMADRVAVLRGGYLQQLGEPQEIYDSPCNLFVASFIGSPAMNLLSGTIEDVRADAVTCRLGRHVIDVPEPVARRHRLDARRGETLAVGMRPEHLSCNPPGDAAGGRATLRAQVSLVESLGAEVLVHARVSVPPVTSPHIADATRALDIPTLDTLASSSAHQALTTMVARVDPAHRPEVDAEITLAIDPAKLYFFDPVSGDALS
jgi:multiple sugar transport system ATP-binding protein